VAGTEFSKIRVFSNLTLKGGFLVQKVLQLFRGDTNPKHKDILRFWSTSPKIGKMPKKTENRIIGVLKSNISVPELEAYISCFEIKT